MLLVKTKIKKSTIPNAGYGCFADEFIPKGTKIWELNLILDRVYSIDDIVSLPKITQDYIYEYSYSFDGKLYLCNDNARFFNHSIDRCNTYDPIEEDQSTYALRDINLGEEILSNYGSFGKTESDRNFNLQLY